MSAFEFWLWKGIAEFTVSIVGVLLFTAVYVAIVSYPTIKEKLKNVFNK